jgi:hypothetical protein
LSFKSLRNYLDLGLGTGQLKHNGPPVKLVSVAERLEAETTKASSGKSPGTQPEGVKHGVVFAI